MPVKKSPFLVCGHCGRGGGALRPVKVRTIRGSEKVRTLHLCSGCVTRPDALWRRTYREL